MFNITNHQRNANQNHAEILLYTIMIPTTKKKKKPQKLTSVGRDVEKLDLVHCWWDCKMVQPL